MTENPRIARLMRAAVVMLASAADDVASGRYSDAELRVLADGLDLLVSSLRGESANSHYDVVDSERTGR